MRFLSKASTPQDPDSNCYIFQPANVKSKMFKRLRQHIEEGDWIEHDIEGSNLIDQILLGHCRAIGKDNIVVRPENEWPENVGVSE